MVEERDAKVVSALKSALDEFRSKHPLYSLLYWIYSNRDVDFYEVDIMVYRLIYRIHHSDGIAPYTDEYRQMIRDIAHYTDVITTKMTVVHPFPDEFKASFNYYISNVSRTLDGFIEFVKELNMQWLTNLL